MSRRFSSILAPLVLILAATPVLRAQDAAELDARTVNLAIERAVGFLVSRQDRAKRVWDDHHGQPGGLTALCTLALLNSGVPATDERVSPALDHLCNIGKPRMVYSSSLTIMALAAAYPSATEAKRTIFATRIKEHALWLEAVQNKEGLRKGGWGYSKEEGNGDNSNSQFALLALHEAERTLPDLRIAEQTWRLALNYWISQQAADGSWSYIKGAGTGLLDSPSGSMTCAGLSSVIIASGQLSEGGATVKDDVVECCGQTKDDDPVERGLRWLGTHFSVQKNPNSMSWGLYYLYGLERVGRMSGRRFFYTSKGSARDWYREGAEFLIKSRMDTLTGRFTGQSGDELNVPELSTAFSLLFLAKGRRPIVMAKLRYGEGTSLEWDRHRSGVPHLISHVERLWKKDLSWQTIDLGQASTVDLLEAPILFLSGSSAISLSDTEKNTLREYVQQGGFIFAEARNGEGCTGTEFDRSFRELLAELFPDSRLRLLPPDHPVWYAEEKVDPRFLKPLYGLDTCCRTSVVYCPENLSCFWELKRPLRGKEYPAKVKGQVDACAAIGANVTAYATNRELKEKLDKPKFAYASASPEKPRRASLTLPKLAHGGGSDDAPNAVRNLLRVLDKQLEIRTETRTVLLPADNAELFDYPIAFIHGRRHFSFDAAERAGLRRYLEQGGFVFGDAICAQKEFAESLRRELQAALPEAKWQRIPISHPIFTSEYRGFDVKSVSLRDPQARGAEDKLTARVVKVEPWLEGLEWEGRYVAIFSPNDLSCALENSQSLECKGYLRDDAARIGANIVLYALGE